MIELPQLVTGVQILPNFFVDTVVTGLLVANVKIGRATVALANPYKLDSVRWMFAKEFSPNLVIARRVRARH
jgi:hypothetical protein